MVAVPKSKSVNTYLESKNFQTIEQKAIVSSFVKREYFFVYYLFDLRKNNTRLYTENSSNLKKDTLQKGKVQIFCDSSTCNSLT